MCKFWNETGGILLIMLWMSYCLHLQMMGLLTAAETVLLLKNGQNSTSFISKFPLFALITTALHEAAPRYHIPPNIFKG